MENPNPVMRWSSNGRLLYANDACKSLLHFWKQKTGQPLSDELQKDIQEAFETDTKKAVEVEYEGKTFSFMLMPVRERGYVNLYGYDITERRRISRELRQSHADLQDQMNEMKTLLELLPIGVWIGNHDCSVITGNPAAYQVMGLEPDINASITNPAPETPPDLRIFVDGQEVSPENAPMQQVARTGKPLRNIEHELLFKDGRRKAVLANVVPLFDEQGMVRKVIGAYADLTERKQGSERLSQLQQMTAALLEAVTPEQVATIVIQQGVSALLATGGTIFSLTEDGSGLEILYSSMPGSVTRSYQNVPLEMDVPVVRALRSATPIWIKSQQEYKERYPHLFEQIEKWGLQAAAAIPLIMKDRKLGVLTLSFSMPREFTSEDRDLILTLAQQAAQAMERTNLHRQMTRALSELQLTYDQTPIGMIQLDGDLRYRRVNEALARMNGIPAADHIGRRMQNIVPDMAPKLEDGLRRVMATGEPEFDIEIVGETQADPGVMHTWLEAWYPWRNESGKVTGVNIAVQDITKRKRDELALAEYARQQTALYELADKLHRTRSMQDIFDTALEAISIALSCDRASILLFGDDGIMHFIAWRGLSDAYRQATDGHSPWKPDEKNVSPISYNDIRTAALGESLKNIIQKEGIGSLAFIPLVFEEKLIGKFMVYFNAPHIFSENDLELSQTIAHQVAFGVQRKRAEDALRQSEERFTQFMQHLPGLAWIKDVQGHYVYANYAAQRAFNTPQEQLYGRRDEDIFPVEVAAQFRKNDELALTEGKGIQVVETLEHEDGVHYSLVSKFPIPGPDGNTMLIGGTAFDITERKHAEEALQIRARQQQTVAKLGELALREQDLQKVFEHATNAVTETLGVEFCKVLEILPGGKKMLLRAGVGWKEGLVGIATIGAGFDSQAGYTIMSEEPVILDDLRLERRFDNPPLLTEHGVISGISCIIRGLNDSIWGVIGAHSTQHTRFSGDDVNFLVAVANILGDAIQREQAERALRESEKRYRAVVESQAEMLCRFQLDGKILFVNGAYARARGATRGELLRQNFWDFVAEEDQPHVRAILDSLTPEAPEVSIENRFHTTDGERWTLWTNRALRFAPDGKLLEAQSTGIDITDRKRAEDALLESQIELQILNDTLEQKVQAQTAEIRKLASDLTKAEQRERNRVARILHDDLQQRLYAIQIQLTTLTDLQENGNEREQKSLATIRKQLQEAVLLTRHLSIDLSPPILHDEGLTQAVEWLASQMKKQHGLHVDLQAEESFANPDEDLRVLVFNCIRELLFNIVKHAGGDQAHVTLRRVDSNLQVEVRDEGKGFNIAGLSWQTLNIPDDEEHVPHSQSFGLPTIYHQLNLFGGQMNVKSEPGKGTVVTITIPYA
jgi:PAS domain S-box-containing protein